MKEPVDHILRPQLPWRTGGGITECGYNSEKVPTITRTAYFDRRKELGQQRCAILTCMTCAQTAERWTTWEDDPRPAMQRELEWEWGHGYYRSRDSRGTLLRDELLSIAALIDAHRDEFDAHIAAAADRRAWVEKKETLAKQKARTPRGHLL
ncbi:MAG: hypothetical protein ACYC3L_00635 [Gemmatimonadaceae bacterium]